VEEWQSFYSLCWYHSSIVWLMFVHLLLVFAGGLVAPAGSWVQHQALHAQDLVQALLLVPVHISWSQAANCYNLH
jgi:hypothetical protein